jgi:hypothetical protein
MNESELHEKVLSLIASKREGDYWDFKREHHNNKAELLHDILCMANSQNNNDSYIIFGVEDKTGDIVGVENDTNRRNQQGIIDFLRSKNFAGDYRPTIELRTVVFQQHEVDVLVVFDTLNTPFYLSQDYSDGEQKQRKIVRANYIYTCVGDTNNPIDKSADIHSVEYLWKKRFGLNLSPYERVCELMKDRTQWQSDEGIHYHKAFPEFTIELIDDEDTHSNSKEYYAFAMMNTKIHYGMANIKYFETQTNSQSSRPWMYLV